MGNIKIGYAPTRRSIFSASDAVKYRGLTADRLRELSLMEMLLYGSVPEPLKSVPV